MRLERLHENKMAQFSIALACGLIFGFLLQKGGVTSYDVIIGQLLLNDFTVLKVMMSAVVVGSVGIYGMKSMGLVRLHPKPGSLGSSVPGGLIFGFGFAVLGFCPGTLSGAIGSGAVDALIGGLTGMLVGTGIYAAVYPKLRRSILGKGDFGTRTLPEVLKVNPWFVVVPGSLLIVVLLFLLEKSGL